MSKIIIVAEKNNISDIKEILKTLNLPAGRQAPDVEVNFIDKELVAKIPPVGGKGNDAANETYLVFSYDDSELREACRPLEIKKISFGFSEEADFFASDQINTEEGISFKLNYKGNSVPVWIKSPFDNEKIYNVLAAICVAVISGLNIVEISEKIKG